MSADSNVLLLPLCFFGLYMILEAADWGVTLAAPLVSRNEEENKAALGLLKPGLDGNELWFFSTGNLNDTAIGTNDAAGPNDIIQTGYREIKYTRTKTTTYYYSRWETDWTYSSTPVNSYSDRQIQYRYRRK